MPSAGEKQKGFSSLVQTLLQLMLWFWLHRAFTPFSPTQYLSGRLAYTLTNTARKDSPLSSLLCCCPHAPTPCFASAMVLVWCLGEPIHSNNWTGQKLNFFSSLAEKLGVPELLLTLKKSDFFLQSVCVMVAFQVFNYFLAIHTAKMLLSKTQHLFHVLNQLRKSCHMSLHQWPSAADE